MALFSLAALSCLNGGLAGSIPKIIGNGVVILNDHLAYDGRDPSGLSESELKNGRWTVYLSNETPEAEVERICRLSSCGAKGRSDKRNMHYVEMRGTEEEVSSVTKASGSYASYVEPGKVEVQQADSADDDGDGADYYIGPNVVMAAGDALDLKPTDEVASTLNGGSFSISVKVTPTILNDELVVCPLSFESRDEDGPSTARGISIVAGEKSAEIRMSDGTNSAKRTFTYDKVEVDKKVAFDVLVVKTPKDREVDVLMNGIFLGAQKFDKVSGDVYNSTDGILFGEVFYDFEGPYYQFAGTFHSLSLTKARDDSRFLEVTLLIAFSITNLVLIGLIVNAFHRTCNDKDGQHPWSSWIFPVVVAVLIAGDAILVVSIVGARRFFGTSGLANQQQHLTENATRYLMIIGILWFLLTVIWETKKKHIVFVEDKEYFEAGNLYTDLTMPMFKVIAHFALQSSLMILLVWVGQDQIKSGIPKEQSVMQTLINVLVCIYIQLSLFVKMRAGDTWEQVIRLRNVEAVTEDMDECESVIKFPSGDYWARLAMSILTKGIFNKFLIVAYPLYIIGTDNFLDLVKDAFAITFVVELDDMDPVPFRVLIESAKAMMKKADEAFDASIQEVVKDIEKEEKEEEKEEAKEEEEEAEKAKRESARLALKQARQRQGR